MGSFLCCLRPPVPKYHHNRKRREAQSKDQESTKITSSVSVRRQQLFRWPQLVIITNNFAKIIGEGGFGIVYYGKLENNTEVAVKVLSKSTAHAYKQFQAEAEILSKVQHRNLVRLIGYCNDESNTAIVYEYVTYGSLYDHLRGTTHISSALNWRTRLKIALGAAQGLNYVHSGCKLVHRDVKIANILLDKDLVAKVADFGLTREFDDFTKTMTICGTPGYFDPQIECTGRFNDKTDIYSFGVVLLELMTGKKPCFMNEQGDIIHLTTSISQKLAAHENITTLVDPRIGEYNEESMKKFAKLAIRCIRRDQMKRPSMAFVAVELQGCLNMENASEQNKDICSASDTSQSDSFNTTPNSYAPIETR